MAPPSGAATSRWDVAQRPVSAAASVGDGRSPLGCITRGGSRDAGTAAAVTERATRQRPHNPVSPRRRLYQRAVHAWGGVTGKLGGNLRGIEDAIKKPPARVSYGKQSTGLFSYFPALADATKTLGALPPIPPPPLKRWTKLLPAYGAHVRWPLDEHERSELPKARLAWGATPAHVR